MDERVKFKCRRVFDTLLIEIWFDDCQLGSRIITGGDKIICDLVEAGELRLNEHSQLVYVDGELYTAHMKLKRQNHERIKAPRTTSSGYHRPDVKF